MPALRLTVYPTILLLLVGCYTFNPAGKSSIQAIAVERFDNKTTEYDLADRMTDLVIDAFLADGTMKVVSADNADAVLVGELTGYQRKPFEYDENGVVISYSVTMTFDLLLKNPNDNDSEIWRENMVQEGVYNVDSQTEQDGQNSAVQRLIVEIINRTTKSW
ncbi:MAG: LPS assembly lipoprotein LptE [candidate division Zixibacteria bacterium]|nr:LPS assembly lipoprotein LptE [candidate division Zixibacteria bacterium]